MPFADLITEKKLSKSSNFSAIAQAAIDTYYLVPYKNQKPTTNGQPNRLLHGGVHVSRTAMNLEMFFQLYKKYKPELLKHPTTGKDLTPEDLSLLKLAAIYHDSANISEISGDEKAHADNFRRDMIALGWTKDEIEPFAMAIQQKDGKLGKTKRPDDAKREDKNILQKLLHDADSLDIIRVVSDNFKKDLLDIIKDLQDLSGFSAEIDAVINNHFGTIAAFASDESKKASKLHMMCENASDCYSAVYQAQRKMLVEHIVFSCLKAGKCISVSDIDLSEITLLDLYNRGKSERVKQIIMQLTEPSLVETKTSSLPLDTLFDQGCLVRSIDGNEIDNEFRVLRENLTAMQRIGIHTPDQLKDYLEQEIKKGGLVHTPQGFKWRPCSFYQAGLPIKFYNEELNLIIDPAISKGTQLSYFYKENANSWYATKGTFTYNPEKGGRKNKQTIDNLRDKEWEKEKRRRGSIPDTALHYFGEMFLSHTELLGTYEEKGIVGIIVGNKANNAKDALLLRAQLGEPFRPFYRYTPETGMVLISESEIINQSGILKSASLSEKDQLVIDINNSISGLLEIRTPELKERDFGEELGISEVATWTISYTWNESDKNKNSICDALINLKKLEPASLLSADPVTQVEIKKSDNRISISIESLYDSKIVIKETNTVHLNILKEIQKAATSSHTMEPAAIDEKQIREIKEIKEIKIPLSSSTLHSKSRIGYEFMHPNNPKIKCEAFVNREGTPIMRFSSPDDKKQMDKPTTLLPAIAKLYAERQVSELNLLLQSKEIMDFLKSKGIQKISVSLIPTSSKSELKWTLKTLDKENIDAIQADFIAHLSPLFKKVKNITAEPTTTTTNETENIIVLKTPYVQHDNVPSLLKKILEMPERVRDISPHI